MDVVLEVFDQVVLDRLYAAVAPSPILPVDHINNISGNATRSTTPYIYRPASQYLQLEPSEYAYRSAWPRDNPWRQLTSLYLITWIFGVVVYFVTASLSYLFLYDKESFKHPRFLKNQIRMEIKQANWALPVMALFTVPCFLAEVRGYSKLFDTAAEAPSAAYIALQFPLFILFTDFCIYWIHRGLHHPRVYKTLHKPHHKWIIPTPYASHAFHPLDGFAQSIPYHVFPFVFPLQKWAYVALFTFINVWTVFIHDGEYIANSPIINGAACHSLHHLYFNYNYGQFSTLWDRLGGSYRKPNDELFHKETKMGKQEWERQTREMERIVKEVEGSDERRYEGKKAQ